MTEVERTGRPQSVCLPPHKVLSTQRISQAKLREHPLSIKLRLEFPGPKPPCETKAPTTVNC
jgi:hypothetical protein